MTAPVDKRLSPTSIKTDVVSKNLKIQDFKFEKTIYSNATASKIILTNTKKEKLTIELDLFSYPPILKYQIGSFSKTINFKETPTDFIKATKNIYDIIKANRYLEPALIEPYAAFSNEKSLELCDWSKEKLKNSVTRNVGKNVQITFRSHGETIMKDSSRVYSELEQEITDPSKKVLIIGEGHGSRIWDDMFLVVELSRLKKIGYSSLVVEGFEKNKEPQFSKIGDQLSKIHSLELKMEFLKKQPVFDRWMGNATDLTDQEAQSTFEDVWGSIIKRHLLLNALINEIKIICPEQNDHASVTLTKADPEANYVLGQRNASFSNSIESRVALKEKVILFTGTSHVMPIKETLEKKGIKTTGLLLFSGDNSNNFSLIKHNQNFILLNAKAK